MSHPNQPWGGVFDQATLRKILEIVENRIRELDRHGPPNARGHGCAARGHGCAACKDAELHRLAAILEERVER
jgi:hypothetical protein